MGKNIKGFNDWQQVNEGSWLDSIAAMAKSVGSFIAGGDTSSMTLTAAPTSAAPTASAASTANSTTASTATSTTSSAVKPESEVNKNASSNSPAKKESSVKSERFDNLDLKSIKDFDDYEAKCNAWIDLQKPFFNSREYHKMTAEDLGGGEATAPTNRDYVIGQYFAESAKKYYEETGNYVPWELAMAQATQEGGLSSTGKYADGKITRPIKTKNPFNVGNTDGDPSTGRPAKNRYFATIPDGIDAYYKLMTKNYLAKRTADELLEYGNFKNSDGNNYATDEYPLAVAKVVARIKSKVA